MSRNFGKIGSYGHNFGVVLSDLFIVERPTSYAHFHIVRLILLLFKISSSFLITESKVLTHYRRHCGDSLGFAKWFFYQSASSVSNDSDFSGTVKSIDVWVFLRNESMRIGGNLGQPTFLTNVKYVVWSDSHATVLSCKHIHLGFLLYCFIISKLFQFFIF